MKLIFAILLFIFVIPTISSSGPVSTYEINLAPDSGLVTNTAIDIVAHIGGPWLATGKGAVFTFDGGQTWLNYDANNGLVSDDISAIFSISGRIWVGMNRTKIIDDRLESISDGIAFSDDNGNTWTQINFGSGGLNIPFVWGGNQTVFDITGHMDLNFSDSPGAIKEWLFFPAFAGGLLASADGGMNWRRIFPTVNDSIQYNDEITPSLRNRAFSAIVDTSHTDTLILWTGSAGGVFEYIYAPPRLKLFSKVINAIAFCDTCTGTGRIYYAGDNGLSFSNSAAGEFQSRFEDEGILGRTTTSLVDINGRLLVGTIDPATGFSNGLIISDDGAASFNSANFSAVVGSGREITDFDMVGSRLYMAASIAGLFVSPDSATSWSSILLDSANISSPVNSVNATGSIGDTLFLGTDSGFVALYLDPSGIIDSSTHIAFPENDTTSMRIIRLRVEPFVSDTISGIPDSVALWSVTRPATVIGIPALFRSIDRGTTWNQIQAPVTYDVNFVGDTAYVVGELGIRLSISGSDATTIFSAKQFIPNTTIEIANLDNDTVTTMIVRADTIIFGTRRGMAISSDRGASFKIVRPNIDSLKADAVVNFTAVNTFDNPNFGLSGDFVPALGVQYLSSGVAQIWASGRAVDFGGNGVAVARFVLDTLGNTRTKWETVYFDGFAWNFAFAGDSIFVATNGGLLFNSGNFSDSTSRFVWDTVQLVDPSSGASLLDPGAGVFAVEVIGDTLWVGTGDGTISIDLTNPTNQKLFQVVDSATSKDEVYAFPVPFSGRRGGLVDFHFVVDKSGSVTLEIYDFAMNLVARPIDNQFYAAGIYPSGGVQGVTWDGRNGSGDFVAVGVYYFKVKQSNGDIRWGKLAVIP